MAMPVSTSILHISSSFSSSTKTTDDGKLQNFFCLYTSAFSFCFRKIFFTFLNKKLAFPFCSLLTKRNDQCQIQCKKCVLLLNFLTKTAIRPTPYQVLIIKDRAEGGLQEVWICPSENIYETARLVGIQLSSKKHSSTLKKNFVFISSPIYSRRFSFQGVAKENEKFSAKGGLEEVWICASENIYERYMRDWLASSLVRKNTAQL